VGYLFSKNSGKQPQVQNGPRTDHAARWSAKPPSSMNPSIRRVLGAGSTPPSLQRPSTSTMPVPHISPIPNNLAGGPSPLRPLLLASFMSCASKPEKSPSRFPC